MPAFFLKANEDKAFWSNVITAIEYTVDVATTLSGVGNIAKFRYLARLREAGSLIAKIKLGAGIVEVTSGVTNTLLKLTGFEDTKTGKALQEYLFYLELLSLSGELTVAIKNGLQKSAKEVLEHCDDLEKQLDDLVEQGQISRNEADGVLDELGIVAGDNIKGKGLYGGKVLSKTDLDYWAKNLLEAYGTKLQKVESFENPNVLAQFNPNTNTILYKDNVTEYFMLHESFHAEEFKKIGFDEYVKDAPLKGVREADYTTENWIRLYKREKYVYDKLVENARKYKLNSEEISTPPFGHAFRYFDVEIVLKLEIRKIPIPKN